MDDRQDLNHSARQVDAATLLATAGGAHDPLTGAVVPPLQPATTFVRDADHQLADPRFLYSRNLSPVDVPLQALLARLEGGAAALTFASGLAAAATLFAVLPAGAHVVAQAGLYYGLRLRLEALAARGAIRLALFDDTRLEDLAARLIPGETQLVWIETPSNPLWHVVDIAACAELAHRAGARLAVDSTAATPLLTRPLALGADYVMHAATKYLNGHSDLLAGVLVARQLDPAWAAVQMEHQRGGAVLGAFESWLLLRGLRTLDVRMARICDSAARLAPWLASHPAVARVLWPGLPDHPGHGLAARQMRGGFGGMMSFEPRVPAGADPAATAIAVLSRLQVIARATSFGGTETLIEHRRTVEDPASTTPPALLRLSVGLEDPDDLIADLDQALAPLRA